MSDRIYIVSRGWHAEIGLPIGQLGPRLAFYRDMFPGAQSLMFGYGKKTFITAPPETFSEYLLGPVPGPAVIQVMALSVSPSEAYPPDSIVVLPTTEAQNGALTEFIADDLANGDNGQPRIVARDDDPASLFYAADSGYSLFHTCNTWVADALQSAGLPVSDSGVVFSGQVMDRGEDARKMICEASLIH